MALGALSSGCVELPDKAFSCEQDADCERIGGGGAPYVCQSGVCVRPGPDEGQDGGLDGGEDGGSDGGWDGGADGGEDGGSGTCTRNPAVMPCIGDTGWCWDNPLSAGRHLLAIRGKSESDIWAVGADGVALHWNGRCWARSPTGRTEELRGIWPVPGRAWRVVGAQGLVLEWDGFRWTSESLGTASFRDISGSDDSAFAVGDKGTVQFFDGTQWNAQDSGTPSDLRAVWAVSRREAWAFSQDGGIFQGVEGGWTQDAFTPAKPITFESAVGLSDGGILAVGMGSIVRREGRGWTQSDFATPTTRLHGVWHDSGLTWLVGEPWSIYLPDGGTESSGTPRVLHSVWSRGEKAWAVGESGAIVQRVASRWGEVPGGVARTLRGFWPASDGLWAVGEDSLIMRRVDGAWRPIPPPVGNSFRGIWGSGDLLLVLGGGGKVYAYQNGEWSTENPGGGLNALWGTGPDRVWAVGDNGAIWLRGANGSWSKESGPSGVALNAIWGTSDTNVWAVGSNGIYRRKESCPLFSSCTWTWPRERLNPETTSAFRGVWGTGPNNVWAVGNGGAIYHFDGGTWTSQSINPGTPPMNAISGRTDGNQVWAVGDNGLIVSWDGKSWTPRSLMGVPHLLTVWVTEDEVWAGGLHGTIIQHP